MNIESNVKIRFFGELAKKFSKEYNLLISSVGEAFHAININTKRKLYPWLIERDKVGIRYKIVINGEPFKTDHDLTVVQNIQNSELVIKRGNLRSIDVIPVIEGADGDILGIFTIILGVVLAIVGFAFGGPQWGAALVIAGIGLIAGGVTNLLMRPPKFDDFREISSGGGGKQSYLFGGPQNTINEGGPVPVGYGRLLVGSQVVSASYVISNINANANTNEKDTTPGALVIPDKIGIYPSNPLSAISQTAIISMMSHNYEGVNFPKRVSDYMGGTYSFRVNIVDNSNEAVTGQPANGNANVRGAIYTLEETPQVVGGTRKIIVGGEFFFDASSSNLLIFNIGNGLGGSGGTSDDITGGWTNAIVTASIINTQGHMFVAGNFTSIKVPSTAVAVSQNRISKIDGSTKTLVTLSGLGTGANAIVRAIAVDGSGNIFAGGDFTSFAGVAHKRFVKLDDTGALASGFTFVDFNDNSVRDIKIDTNDKIYVCGSFTSHSGGAGSYLIRLNSDGTHDSSFSLPTLAGSDLSVNSIYIQTIDGKILIGGKWNTIGGVASKNLARLDGTTGALDTTFVSRFDPAESCDVFKVRCIDDGTIFNSTDNGEFYKNKILVGGNWKRYAEQDLQRFVVLYNGDYGVA